MLIKGRLQGCAMIMSWQTASASIDQCVSRQALLMRSEKWQFTLYLRPIKKRSAPAPVAAPQTGEGAVWKTKQAQLS